MEYRFDENILYFMRIYEYTKEEKIKINISLLKKKILIYSFLQITLFVFIGKYVWFLSKMYFNGNIRFTWIFNWGRKCIDDPLNRTEKLHILVEKSRIFPETKTFPK